MLHQPSLVAATSSSFSGILHWPTKEMEKNEKKEAKLKLQLSTGL